MDRECSSSRERERELKTSLAVDSQLSSLVTRQGRDTTGRMNVNARPDDASADDRWTFTEVVRPPEWPGTAEFILVNPTPATALLLTAFALRKVQASSQDNLLACASNTAGLSNMYVPPPFTPLGKKAGEAALIKSSSTVMAHDETEMETDEKPSPVVPLKPPVPKPRSAKMKDYTLPSLAHEAGMRQWSNDMLRGHPGGCATTWEQWGNSFLTQFKGVVDTMSHSLRIKEGSYINMFMEKEKAISDAKETF